jgi:hypothetical protein
LTQERQNEMVAECPTGEFALCPYIAHRDEAHTVADLTWCRRTGRIVDCVSAVDAGRILKIVEEPALRAQRCSVRRSRDKEE